MTLEPLRYLRRRFPFVTIAPMRSIPAATALAILRDSLLLEGASRRIQSRSPEKQRQIRELYDAASSRAAIASELLDARQHGAAFSLLREAIALYASAMASAHLPSQGEVLSGEAASFLLDELLAAGVLSNAPPELPMVRSWLEDADPLAFDRLSHEEALARRAHIDKLVEYLRDRIEPRTLGEILLVRRIRIGALALVMIAALSMLGWKALAPANIALGKPVVASSRHPQSTAPPHGLTDGSTAGGYGVHTKDENDAWVMVDLQSVQKVGVIKVFNRGDGYFDEGLPLALELSVNGTDFVEVDQRKLSFSRFRPWTFDADGKEARFVRIRKMGRGYVALSELEVYGAR